MKKKRPITKAVIATAGYGTRFLPATKNQPKQMLPIIDKPIIHHVVEEAVNSGIKDVILVTQFGAGSMEDYFDNHFELEKVLEESGKTEMLEMLQSIPQLANFIYTRQKKNLPYGNGSPLISVKDLIDDDEAFVYMFGDDLTLNNNGVPVTKQLIDVYEEHNPAAILAVQEVPDEEVHRYGIVKYKDDPEHKYEVSGIYEKLPLGQNPSNMAQFGRFVFSYKVIENIVNTATGKDGELWATDVLNDMAKAGDKIIAQPIEGEWLTTGDPLTYLKTTVRFALEREDLSKEIKNYLKELII
jgi:UTP--glucose-1-phosphate uridylyltransferase